MVKGIGSKIFSKKQLTSEEIVDQKAEDTPDLILKNDIANKILNTPITNADEAWIQKYIENYNKKYPQYPKSVSELREEAKNIKENFIKYAEKGWTKASDPYKDKTLKGMIEGVGKEDTSYQDAAYQQFLQDIYFPELRAKQIESPENKANIDKILIGNLASEYQKYSNLIGQKEERQKSLISGAGLDPEKYTINENNQIINKETGKLYQQELEEQRNMPQPAPTPAPTPTPTPAPGSVTSPAPGSTPETALTGITAPAAEPTPAPAPTPEPAPAFVYEGSEFQKQIESILSDIDQTIQKDIQYIEPDKKEIPQFMAPELADMPEWEQEKYYNRFYDVLSEAEAGQEAEAIGKLREEASFLDPYNVGGGQQLKDTRDLINGIISNRITNALAMGNQQLLRDILTTEQENKRKYDEAQQKYGLQVSQAALENERAQSKADFDYQRQITEQQAAKDKKLGIAQIIANAEQFGSSQEMQDYIARFTANVDAQKTDKLTAINSAEAEKERQFTAAQTEKAYGQQEYMGKIGQTYDIQKYLTGLESEDYWKQYGYDWQTAEREAKQDWESNYLKNREEEEEQDWWIPILSGAGAAFGGGLGKIAGQGLAKGFSSLF